MQKPKVRVMAVRNRDREARYQRLKQSAAFLAGVLLAAFFITTRSI